MHQPGKSSCQPVRQEMERWLVWGTHGGERQPYCATLLALSSHAASNSKGSKRVAEKNQDNGKLSNLNIT